MPTFSRWSMTQLNSCHPSLVKLFTEVIKHWDCRVLEGYRNEHDQTTYFNTGRSELEWPDGNHNFQPSLAVDVVPYPVDWNDREGFLHFTGFVLGVATQMGLKIRLGIDWNGDHQFNEKFVDSPHFELVLYEG